MGKELSEIPPYLIKWIGEQKMFWVATAPLSPDGHVNVSPKGYDGTFHIVNANKVWYEDMSGSGVETIAHVRENKRITILFSAFEGPPRIARLFGTAEVHEFDTPGYNALVPLEKRCPGSRSVIVIDVHRVGTSCGYAIPFYTFKSHRLKLNTYAQRLERVDIKAASECDVDAQEPPLPEKGLKWWWKNHNNFSIDGIPACQDGFKSTTVFSKETANRDYGGDDQLSNERLEAEKKAAAAAAIAKTAVPVLDSRLVTGFALGVLASGLVTYGSKLFSD